MYLTSHHKLHCFMTICTHSWIWCTPTRIGYSRLFQQDNSFCNQAQFGQNWFEKYFVDSWQMVWPVHLLDMNPTEHLWDMVERSIYMQDTTLPNIPNCEQLLRWHGLLVTCRINVKLLSCQASMTLDTYPMIFGTQVYLCVCFYLEQLEICIIFLLKRQQWKEKLKKISFFITSSCKTSHYTQYT